MRHTNLLPTGLKHQELELHCCEMQILIIARWQNHDVIIIDQVRYTIFKRIIGVVIAS